MEFADIALAKFLQTAPELGPLIVNFSEVNDDMGDSGSGVKVGVFILRTGAGIGYAPVISKGDTIFPIDSIFLEDEGIFRPISNSTINYLVNSASGSIGKAVKIPETVDQNPSLYNLVNPPRTGKFVYASASRLPEFLAVVPKRIRQELFEKIAAEQSVYNALDKLFGLKAIFSVLNGHGGGSGSVNNVATGPDAIRQTQVSVITTPQEVQALLNDAASKTFLEQGYVIQGGHNTFRSAVSYFPYDKIGSYLHVSPFSDGGKDYRIAFEDGTTKDAFLPKYHILNPNPHKDSLASVFVDGSYARGELISVGDPLIRKEVLDTLFSLKPPKLLRELERGEQFLMFTTAGEALGPFEAHSVTRTAIGVDVKTYAGKVKRIAGYNNFTKEVDCIGDTLFVPHNIIVLPLGADVTDQKERSINSALDKSELSAAQLLGQEMNLRYDGIEFSSDNRVLGKFASAMKYLVEGELLEPVVAENFLKQAQETSYLKIFLSKAASSTDFQPTQVPQYGNVPDKTDEVGLNGSAMPAIQASTALGDSQVVESTIISQLLQVPDLFEYIQEYLPDLEQTVDRLGRILFLTRLKIDQISGALDSDSVFSMISQIKTVYRQLGDTSMKLKTISNASIGFNKEESKGKPEGI
jgi:hypothetical protein